MDLRLLLVSHAATAAQRAGRFPAGADKAADTASDALDTRSIAEAQAARARLALPHAAAVLTSPAACARETASALGLAAMAVIDRSLADMNYGRWHGRKLSDIADDAGQDLVAWTRDPDAAPHGGESFSRLVSRVGTWLDALDLPDARSVAPATANAAPHSHSHSHSHSHDIVAITHAPLIRAAIVHTLGASAAVFARIEIAPLSVVELRRSPRRGWTWWPASPIAPTPAA